MSTATCLAVHHVPSGSAQCNWPPQGVRVGAGSCPQAPAHPQSRRHICSKPGLHSSPFSSLGRGYQGGPPDRHLVRELLGRPPAGPRGIINPCKPGRPQGHLALAGRVCFILGAGDGLTSARVVGVCDFCFVEPLLAHVAHFAARGLVFASSVCRSSLCN